MNVHSKAIDTKAVLEAFGSSVPRYTSYPTAPHFKAELGHELIEETLGGLSPSDPVSLYLHIPFCDRLCWFCGCNTKQTNKYRPVEHYVNHLLSELELYQERTDGAVAASHVHFGGGSPSMLNRHDAERLGKGLREAFRFNPDTEISIEVDPSDMDDDKLLGFTHMGATRASIGVQDFDPVVQTTINRIQTFEQTRDVVIALRESGVQSLNIDILYGLPFQTKASLQDTIEKVILLKPDRIALFGYAHVPWVKKHQNMIPSEALPDVNERFEQALFAADLLVQAGYCAIGIDHFARPDDSLALSVSDKTLQRNFQGYTTDNCKTMLGLGASSIGKSEAGFIQNAVATGQYQTAVGGGSLPVSKGLRLTLDDRIRSHIIEQIMCYFEVDSDAVFAKFGKDAEPYQKLIDEVGRQDLFGLVDYADGKLRIPQHARSFTRMIASRFDAYLENSSFRYSIAV